MTRITHPSTTRRRTARSALLALPVALFALAACGSSGDGSQAGGYGASGNPTTTVAVAATDGPAVTTQATTPDTATGATTGDAASGTVNIADNALGKILVDSSGRTLYLFTNDTPTAPACTTGCLSKWPALVAGGTVTPGAGLSAEDFGTVTAADGSTQVTFYGHPLYYFAGDSKPGDTNGQAVGGVWFVVDGEGNAVK